MQRNYRVSDDTWTDSESVPWMQLPPMSASGSPEIDEDPSLATNVQVYQAKNHLIVKAEMPGFDPEDIDVWGDERAITVQGQRTQESPIDEPNVRGRRKVQGSFHLQVELPFGVDPDAMRVAYQNGVLEIVVPQHGQEDRREI